MGKRKHFYFSSRFQYVLDHIENQPNHSQYIIDLVIKDMERKEKGIDPEILEHVNQLVNARLENINIVVNNKNDLTKDSEEGETVSFDDVEDLF